MNYKITYNFASRSRPEKFLAALENIREMSASDNYEVIAKLDSDDYDTISHLLKNKKNYPEVTVYFGKSESKVHAINRDLEAVTGQIICNHSDDMFFTVKGFDDIIRREMEPDTYLHFPDGYTNERLCTYSIMHVDYYKRFNYIYNPNYKSLWCDNESMEVAKILGRYKYVDEKILEHRHPAWGHGEKDAQYRKTEKFNILDKATYMRRKKINFGL
jgi:hypothetical protein